MLHGVIVTLGDFVRGARLVRALVLAPPLHPREGARRRLGDRDFVAAAGAGQVGADIDLNVLGNSCNRMYL